MQVTGAVRKNRTRSLASNNNFPLAAMPRFPAQVKIVAGQSLHSAVISERHHSLQKEGKSKKQQDGNYAVVGMSDFYIL